MNVNGTDVFISYAWGGESEEIVNEIEKGLHARGLKIILDKHDLDYKGSIKGFIERIDNGAFVIVVLSDKYLKSPNCMFELVEIAANKQLHDRVFPVVLLDANIYDPAKRIEYIKYWEEKGAELAHAIKTSDPENLQGIRERLDLYGAIRDAISRLTNTLKNMNTLSPDIHKGSDFSQLFNWIYNQQDEIVLRDDADIMATSEPPPIGWTHAKPPKREEERLPLEKKEDREGIVIASDNNSIAVGSISVGSDISGNIHIGNVFHMEDNGISRRLLNAGFANRNGDVLNRDQALAGNDFYDLLIDVGPLWKTVQSMVIKSEKAYFPEEKLPANQKGYKVRVVFVSEDFSPHLSSAEIWVPANKGQSYPFVNGKLSDAPGPINLRIRAPRLGLFQKQGRANGRLCLYYKGQLIQSALVSIGIANSQSRKLEEPNKIEIDYVLTTDFETSSRLGERQVQFGTGKEARPVSVSLTLNDDGSGRHRILATYHLNSKEETTVPPAWAPYDAQSAQQTLIEFREVMAECYKGLDQNFGKPRKQFGKDMLKLAKLGDRLRTLALSDMDVSGSGKTVALWRRELLGAMKTATVIQVARTGPANYVFPWALVYQYPMTGPDYKLCKVIEEWDENGVRNKTVEMACPHQDEDWHQENIVCPYGFWGYKHIIEQPTGSIHKQDGRWAVDVSDKVLAGKNIGVGAGVTYDIDQVARDQHISRLVKNMKAHLEPQHPAHNRKSTLEMLHAPEIVYFLCHGEVDTNQIPYLSIGEHINNTDYEIFPNTLEQWSLLTQDGLDLAKWQMKRPLIFINGCHTTDLRPGVVLNFVSAFSDLGASGVIGTEVSVLADMAMKIAEAILERFGNGMEIGQAVREMRWEMLNRGNLLGLAYTPYSLANLHIERNP